MEGDSDNIRLNVKSDSPVTHCQIQKTLKYFLLGLKCLVCEAGHLPPSVGKLKSEWNITCTQPHVFVCDAQFVTEKSQLSFP
jgi:hypothetical protein